MIQLIFLIFSASLALADDPKEIPSSIQFRVDGGSDNYHALGFKGKFTIDDTFHAIAEIEHSRSNGTGSSGSIKAGGGVQFVPALQFRGALMAGQEPNLINSFGFNVGLDWTANPGDHDEHETLISFDFISNTYRQKGAVRDISKSLSQRFLERTWMLSVNQEVSSDFSMNGFGSSSSYPSHEANRPNSATDFRRRRLSDLTATVAGFKQYSFGIGGDLKLSELWTFSLDLTRTRIFFTEADATSISPSLAYEFDNDWILGTHVSYTRQDLEDPSVVGALSLTHLF